MESPKVASAASAVLLVGLVAGAVVYARHVPPVVAASAPLTVFSGQRALVDVIGMAKPPSVVGGARNAIARAFIESELRAAAIPYQEQRTIGIGTRYAVAGPVTNVLVRLPGRQPGGPAVLLMAHYDAVPMSPGAGDDGSGCAVLLETLRALRAGPALRHDVIALFTDGEEAGLLGAAAFVREHPWARDVAVAMNFEARGTYGPSLMFETGRENLESVRVLRRVGGVRATSLSTAVYRRMPNDTDLSELDVLGMAALNFAFIGGVERYHTAEDDLAHLDAHSLQHHGNSAVALTRIFANGELPLPQTSDAVFFDFPGVGVVVYPESWALVFAAIAAILAIVVLLGARRRSGRIMLGALGGVAVTVVTAIVAAVVCALVAMVLQRAHGASPAGGNPAWSALYACALGVIAFAVGTLGYAIVRRRIDALALASGAYVAWALVSVACAFVLPAASYLFTWPVIAMALAALVRDRWPHPPSVVATWIAVAVAVLIIVPVVYTMAYVALGVDVPGAVILGMLLGLATSLVSPAVEIMGGSRVGRVPAAAAVVGALLLVAGAFTLRTGERHPGGAGLIYAVDADSNTAWLTGYASSPSARQAVLGVLRHAAEGKTASRRPPAWVGRPFGDRSIIEAPMLNPAPPSVVVISDASTAGVRRVSMRIRPNTARHAIYVTVDTALAPSLTVDGKPVDRRRYRYQSSRWNLQYMNPPDSGFTVDMTLAPGAHGTVYLRGVALGIPPSPDFHLPPRPEHILPIQNGDMTWIYKRVPF